MKCIILVQYCMDNEIICSMYISEHIVKITCFYKHMNSKKKKKHETFR